MQLVSSQPADSAGAGRGAGLSDARAHDRDARTGAGQRRHRRRADRTRRPRPHAGARGDPAAGLGRPARGAAARRHGDRAAARRATGCACSTRARGVEKVLARSAARFVTARGGGPFPCGSARHAEGGHCRQCHRLSRSRQGAGRGDSGRPPTIRSPPGWRRRCRRTAAASGSATRATPALPRPPSATSR